MIAEAETRVRATPLVARIYGNQPCLRQSGGKKMVYDAVIDLGDAGPVVLFWQCSARTEVGARTLSVEPVVNDQDDERLKTQTHVNPKSVHAPLLRRRVQTRSLPQGQSIFAVRAGEGVVTDENYTVNMIALDISDMANPPLVRLDAWGPAERGDSVYAERTFTTEGGPMLVSLAATARPRKAGQLLMALAYLDNQPVAVMQIFANQADQHICMVGGDRVLDAAAGQHTLRLVGSPDVIVDQNDYWSMSVLEMRKPASAAMLLDNGKCQAQQGEGVIATAEYESHGGQHLMCVWLSGYSHTADRTLMARVLVDDNPVGRLQVHANQADTHVLLCGGDIAAGSIPKGKHTIKVVSGNKDTITDVNDRVSLTVLEVYR